MAKIKERGKKRKKKRNERRRNKRKRKRRKNKKERIMKVKKVIEEWEIQDEEKEVAKSEKEAKKLVSQRFHRQIYIFRKKQSKRMLMRKLQDYAVERKRGFVLRERKVYPLLREERKEVHEFILEQLRKEYIRLSKLFQTASAFFVRKKNGEKYIVQDYCYLNEWTIKKNYSLSLISDIVENIDTKKVFTKLDLCWGYNNIQIKEEDEWKAVLTTPKGSFKPMVMFFRLTSSLAMFQTIMNEILQNLINTGEVASFIDDIIVGIEEEEEHDEVVEEVVKRLVENNLYIKLEKYKQKVREIGFLRVVIGSEGIKQRKKR